MEIILHFTFFDNLLSHYFCNFSQEKIAFKLFSPLELLCFISLVLRSTSESSTGSSIGSSTEYTTLSSIESIIRSYTRAITSARNKSSTESST